MRSLSDAEGPGACSTTSLFRAAPPRVAKFLRYNIFWAFSRPSPPGQEASIVIYSMTTSSPDDPPRGMEFSFSLNRLNVASSRARCVCILVANPRFSSPNARPRGNSNSPMPFVAILNWRKPTPKGPIFHRLHRSHRSPIREGDSLLEGEFPFFVDNAGCSPTPGGFPSCPSG